MSSCLKIKNATCLPSKELSNAAKILIINKGGSCWDMSEINY